MAGLDRSLFLWLNGLHWGPLDQVMVVFSGQLIWIPLVMFFLWKAHKQDNLKGAGLFALFLLLILVCSDVTSSYVIKNLSERLRPCRVEDLKTLIYSFGQKCGGKYGFVSSHAANSLGLVLFSILALRLPRKAWAFILLPLIVGYSRIYLGVHYPGDILGGFVVGSFWAIVMLWFYRRLRVPDAT